MPWGGFWLYITALLHSDGLNTAGQKSPMKSLWLNVGCHICTYQCSTNKLINKIFKQFLKKKARKAESSHGDSRGNFGQQPRCCEPLGCQTHYKTWITPTSSQGRSQERQEKMDEKLSACLMPGRRKNILTHMKTTSCPGL